LKVQPEVGHLFLLCTTALPKDRWSRFLRACRRPRPIRSAR
jgi:hypothetical protein